MNEIEIYSVPEARRYWVVRAEGGEYYDHFVRYGLIALGHLDDLRLKADPKKPFKSEFSEIEDRLKKSHASRGHASGKTTIHLNQVKSFLFDMNIGDWVLTVGNYAIRVGRVVGHARIDDEPLEIIYDESRGRKAVLRYNLRRKVVWGPSFRRSKLPHGIRASLRANQTVFNIDAHWRSICHSLYPYFLMGDNLFLSARINTENAIQNYSITQILAFLSEMEVIAKESENEALATNFDQVFKDYVDNGKLTITTKAEFHSPGEIWNMISEIGPWAIPTVLIYSLMFGNKVMGVDGVVDLETRQKIWGIVLDRFNKRDLGKLTKELEVDSPKHDTKILEDDSNDEE